LKGRLRIALLAALAAVLVGPASAKPDAAFTQQHEALLAREDLQFAFTAPSPPPEIDWLVGLIELLAPIVQPLFWAGLFALAAFILYFLLRELVFVRFGWWRRRKTEGPAVQDLRPTPERARLLLSEVDRLAAEGRFADAVRHLLHRSIQDIEERRQGGLSRALTSREIAVHSALPEPARAPFAAIARVVERAFFGGSPVGAQDFAACRDAYARFALPEGAA
jgi:hypothetical protein